MSKSITITSETISSHIAMSSFPFKEFECFLKGFSRELNNLAATIYFKRPQGVFELTEPAYMGIFANAICRANSKAYIVPEYSVYSQTDKHIGRLDLLLSVPTSQYFQIEAKAGEVNKSDGCLNIDKETQLAISNQLDRYQNDRNRIDSHTTKIAMLIRTLKNQETPGVYNRMIEQKGENSKQFDALYFFSNLLPFPDQWCGVLLSGIEIPKGSSPDN